MHTEDPSAPSPDGSIRSNTRGMQRCTSQNHQSERYVMTKTIARRVAAWMAYAIAHLSPTRWRLPVANRIDDVANRIDDVVDWSWYASLTPEERASWSAAIARVQPIIGSFHDGSFA